MAMFSGVTCSASAWSLLLLALVLLAVPASGAGAPPDWADAIERGDMLFSSTLPASQSLMSSISNGYLGTVIYSNATYVNGVFNGVQETPVHRARIPSTVNINITHSELSVVGTALDLRNATFRVRSNTSSCDIEELWYAHRRFRHVLVYEVSVSCDSETVFSVSSGPLGNSEDISLQEMQSPVGAVQWAGDTNIAERGSDVVHVACTSTLVPPRIAVPPNVSSSWQFITVIRTSLDSNDPDGDANADWIAATDAKDSLYDFHVEEWQSTILSSRIEVDGHLELARVVNASLYYVLSSVRNDWAWSIAPEGLPVSDVYFGCVDMVDIGDFWMFPPLLLLFPEEARMIVDYRFDHLDGAQQTAKIFGYDGAMFPWESCFSGHEVCFDIGAQCWIEHHVSGDVVFAHLQYYFATHDKGWLEERAWPVIEGVAQFWASRVELNGSRYEINNIRCVDEYANHVNNCVFTNAIAQVSLNAATELGNVLGHSVPANWTTISQNMYIPFDSDLDIHLEYDTYSGETIKQADVTLMGFPLNYPMSEAVRTADILYYTPRTDKEGPAMTWSMDCISFLELGNETAADASFRKSYIDNVREPYLVWWETISGGAENFLTGAGGFLQAITFGYAGIRLSEDALTLSPTLPVGTKTLRFTSLNYLGSEMQLTIGGTNCFVELVLVQAGEIALCANAVALQPDAAQCFESGEVVSVSDHC